MRLISFLFFATITLSASSQDNYLFSEFTPAHIYYKDAVTPSVLNYNLFTSYMLIQDGDKRKHLPKIEEIDYVNVGNQKFVHLKDHVFGEVVIDGNLMLTQKHTGNVLKTHDSIKSVSKSALNKLLNSGEPLPEGIKIEKEYTYYFYMERASNKTFYLPGANVEKANISGILKLFSKKRAEINTFIKENDIDFTSFDKLKLLVNFCENFTE